MRRPRRWDAERPSCCRQKTAQNSLPWNRTAQNSLPWTAAMEMSRLPPSANPFIDGCHSPAPLVGRQGDIRSSSQSRRRREPGHGKTLSLSSHRFPAAGASRRSNGTTPRPSPEPRSDAHGSASDSTTRSECPNRTIPQATTGTTGSHPRKRTRPADDSHAEPHDAADRGRLSVQDVPYSPIYRHNIRPSRVIKYGGTRSTD